MSCLSVSDMHVRADSKLTLVQIVHGVHYSVYKMVQSGSFKAHLVEWLHSQSSSVSFVEQVKLEQ